MKNEYGITLGRNGYAPSIVQSGEECFFCGAESDLIRHEIYFGVANRDRSKALGCWVHLCPNCHTKLHEHRDNSDRTLKEFAQGCAMTHYGWTVEEFRLHFGKSWV